VTALPSKPPGVKERKLSELKLLDEVQSRVRIELDVVSDYAEVVRAGKELPAIVVFGNIVADGFHRFTAYQWAERKTIPAVTHEGGLRDAILHSCSANTAHGLRRSNADKRRVVLKLLNDPEWQRWSDHRIAETTGVSHPFVMNLRATVESAAAVTERRYIRNGTECVREATPISFYPEGSGPRRAKAQVKPKPPNEPGADMVNRILGAISLLARSDATGFSSALTRTQRGEMVHDLFRARKFLNAL